MSVPCTLKITVAATGETFEVSLVAGTEPAALAHAVGARSGAGDSGFFLTATAARSGAVVPLSATLPSGTSLTLHSAQRAAEPAASVSAAASAPPLEPRSGSSCTTPLLAAAPNGAAAATSAATSSRDEAPAEAERSPTRLRRFSSFGGGFGGGSLKELNQLDGLARLNRMTTDLANERTLLAWIRTALAAIRTVFTYLAVSATSEAWRAAVTTSELAMATLVLVLTVSGAMRYYQVKRVVGLKVPPQGFGRTSIRPTLAVLVVAAGVTASGIYSQKWEHASAAHPPG